MDRPISLPTGLTSSSPRAPERHLVARDVTEALAALRAAQPLCYVPADKRPAVEVLADVLARHGIGRSDVDDADTRLRRWASAFIRLFPELEATAGLIESPLLDMTGRNVAPGLAIGDPAFIKADHALPVAGSVKARGGVYEVIKHAEWVATSAGLLRSGDTPDLLLTPACRALFADRAVAVGSTGNLGLGIGIMASALGFKSVVHMSHDAKRWKKELLRSRGVTVIEHRGDYAAAVAAGRAEAAATAGSYFVDDENSLQLFLGYSTAALRLRDQLDAGCVEVSAERPLRVYLPCGVGGAPAGITFGLKLLYGDAVECYFAEPVASPCFLLRMLTGGVRCSVYDVGLDNRTEADGLAVAEASELAVALTGPLIDGFYTVKDATLLRQVHRLHDEGIDIEPSAAAAFLGLGINASRGSAATEIFWTTGGSFVPAAEMQSYIARGASLAESP